MVFFIRKGETIFRFDVFPMLKKGRTPLLSINVTEWKLYKRNLFSGTLLFKQRILDQCKLLNLTIMSSKNINCTKHRNFTKESIYLNRNTPIGKIVVYISVFRTIVLVWFTKRLLKNWITTTTTPNVLAFNEQ